MAEVIRGRRTDGGAVHGGESLVERLVAAGADLAIVVGPRDRDCVCLDWVGAVVRISGARRGFPTVAEATQDGLFHPGCRHTLAAFDPNAASPNRLAEAKACTQHAIRAMQARAQGKEPPPLAVRRHLKEVAGSKASMDVELVSAFIQNHRLKFERVYESARKALAAGDTRTGRVKCRAALDILRESNIYGRNQDKLMELLAAYVRRLEMGER